MSEEFVTLGFPGPINPGRDLDPGWLELRGDLLQAPPREPARDQPFSGRIGIGEEQILGLPGRVEIDLRHQEAFVHRLEQ